MKKKLANGLEQWQPYSDLKHFHSEFARQSRHRIY
jgi:hypothetical protein